MAIVHFKRLQPPKASNVYSTYWEFAVKRFDVFLNRLADPYGPWTRDPIIQHHRFTNVFRASDRVSQYLIRLQYEENEPQDILFKTLIFKIFNRIETFQYLERAVGNVNFDTFSFRKYDEALRYQMAQRKVIYSAAYIMPSPTSFGFKFKHSNHLALIATMMRQELFRRIQDSRKLEEIYNLLISFPSLGSFLSFQYAIDINYSKLTDFSEMDFVIAGPGARNGIQKCFDSLGDYSYEDVIKWMAEHQETECERLGLQAPNLCGRGLQLIDCQNIFCEVDKYLRVSNPELNEHGGGQKRIKQKYSNSKGPIELFFPPKWRINDKILGLCQMKVAADTYS